MKYKNKCVQAFGTYYLITGLWGLLFINSFQHIVWGKQYDVHAVFVMQSISALFLAIGLTLIFFSKKRITLFLAASSPLLTFIVELFYFKHVMEGLLKYDMIVEAVAGMFFAFLFIRSKKQEVYNEFRLMLYPKQFDEMRSFYANTLRFPIIHEWDEGEDDRGVMFQAGKGVIELLSSDEKTVQAQGMSVSIEVKDVWKMWKQFESSDAVVFKLRDNEWGDTSFCIRDPEGMKLIFFTKH